MTSVSGLCTGHRVKDEDIIRIPAIAHGFFHLPMEEKVKVPVDLATDLNWDIVSRRERWETQV